MSSSIKAVLACLCVSTASLFSLDASAQTAVGPTTIKVFTSAWNDEFAIGTGTALPNPANCGLNDMADASATTTAGYKTFLATALTAVSGGQNVTIVVNNTACSNNRPMIIGLSINP